MRGIEKIGSIALMAVGFLSVTILSGCGAVGSSGTTPPVISISFFGGNSQTIVQGQSANIKANISNDSTGKGVTWQLSGPGALSNVKSTSVEYDAPASVTSNVIASVTATSVADTTKSATFTVTITQPPISVSVSPDSVRIGAQSMQQFTATLQNDLANKGVTWSISPASGAGTLSNVTSTSATYNAPASPPPSDVTVNIMATSVGDTSKSALAIVTLSAIVVTVSPTQFETQAGVTVPVTATVDFDRSIKGVTWSISPASGAGTLSNVTSTSVSYNTPASAPASELLVIITATSVADSTKSGAGSFFVEPITVSISPSSATVQAGGSQSFTSTVASDPTNGGVTWSISPTTGAGTLSNMTGTSVTYHAPADAPASNLTATLTGTSVTDPSKMASTTITVPAISVSVSPSSVLMPVSATQDFKATVNFDPAANGATWAPMQGGALCGQTCGTFVPTSTASNAATTYTSPATLPTNPAVMITATSVTDSTKSGAAKITLTNGTVKLVPASLKFGTTKFTRRPMDVALTNTGKLTLTISSINTTDGYSQTNDCGASVGAGASCTITVAAGVPVTSGTLSINDSSADSPQTVSLSRAGTTGIVASLNSSGTRSAEIAASITSTLATEMTASAPSPMGVSAVGTRVVDLVDSTRDDPFLTNGSKRELLVRFWYPATFTQDCRPAEYTSPATWKYFSQLVGVPLPEVRTNSCQDAAIAEGGHPVVVFTHGYTGTFTDYTFLFEDLASRGYVVASVDHTNEATAVEFPDGRFVKSLFGSHLGGTMRTDEEAYTSAVTARLSDLKFIVKELDRLNATAKGPFAGKLDMSRLAVAGHSLGGLTALLGVEQEPRFRAGISLDGVSPDRAVSVTETPVLILIAGRDQWSVGECSLWSNLHGPRLGMRLPGADHLAPSDAVWLAKGIVKTGGLSPEKTMAVLRNYIAAFLDANLRSQPMNSLLTGPSPDYPDVVVTTQEESVCDKP
jgi:dienelactone hydrolase